MKKVKRLAVVAMSVILLTLNASTMTYGFQNDGKISRGATPANPGKQTVLYADDYVTMYSTDGRTIDVYRPEVENYKKVGWYEWSELYTTLYSKNGQSIAVNKSEVDNYKQSGWCEWDELYVTMHAEDGRTLTVWKDKVDDYINVGWFLSPDEYVTLYHTSYRYFIEKFDVPIAKTNEYIQKGYLDVINEDYVTVLFSADDRKLAVKNAEVETYKKLGWYTYKEYLDIKIDPLIKSRQFEPAMQTLEQAVQTYTLNEGRQSAIREKAQSLRYAWMKVINSPIAIISSNVTDKYNYPKANITFRNISDKTIVSFEIEFVCYDAYGKVTTDYPWLYNGKFTGVSDRDNIPSNELNTYTWTLYSNERTASIKNVRIVKVAYSDGTTWHS